MMLFSAKFLNKRSELVEEFKDFKPEPDEHGQPLTADDLAIPMRNTETEDGDDNADEEWD